jgi:short-subunit dehydrogenase
MPSDPSSSARTARPAAPLRGKTIVLTGASSGIGHAAALAFAAEGASLVLAARASGALQAVAQACVELGAPAVAVPTDVTDAAAVAELARTAILRFGKVDVWINNVGVGAVGRFEDTPMDAHRRVIETNLLGHIHGAHAIVPHFRARRSGTLINMISIGGWVSAPFATAYSASKFGLRGFSEALRAELRDMPQVHVCEVFPTFVDSPGMAHGANYSGRSVRPPPPMVDPRRVADALLELASARRPRRRTYIGAPARPGILAHALAPDLLARSMQWLTQMAQRRAQPAALTDGNLFDASRGHGIDGGFRAPPKPATKATLGLAGAALVLLAVAVRSGRRRRSSPPRRSL